METANETEWQEINDNCIKRIHVNQFIIRANKKSGAKTPPLSVKHKNKTIAAAEVTIPGPSRIVYSPEQPLSCGARVWLETTSSIGIKKDVAHRTN